MTDDFVAALLPLFNIICWSYVLLTLGGLL